MWEHIITLLITTVGSVVSGYFASRSRAHSLVAETSAQRAEVASLRPPR